MNIEFKELKEENIDKLIPIMKAAFDYDTKIHLDKECGGPSGYDDGTFLRRWALDENTTSLCIYENNNLIGAVILWINSNNENYLGNIFIDINYENKGIGTRVWNLIEKLYPDTKIWNTETPIFSRRNHNFYVNKCGFSIIKIENPKDINEGSYILQKVINIYIKDSKTIRNKKYERISKDL
ncbi:GNAT family N-acetyltransferase [uncultured Clostridium sp.]|uniref:GNAT family N-acetyltransferase n=1 Tax=uncultured Clostridium sp. TaxID=59620 RepID=UPI00261895CE|nr:GNAT family N-acetyltransferase [uncultured Clostridium sp.]